MSKFSFITRSALAGMALVAFGAAAAEGVPRDNLTLNYTKIEFNTASPAPAGRGKGAGQASQSGVQPAPVRPTGAETAKKEQ